MAGWSSYQFFTESGVANPESFTMGALSGPVRVNTFILIAAGVIMVLAIWLSKKSRSVIKTSVDLSRQSEGHERFGSSLIAREIVRMGVTSAQTFGKIVPSGLKKRIAKQFEPRVYSSAEIEQRPAFDMLRASVSLIVASILIALGTSLKLPLSTTYVTFMVAMATSFADKSWGRESAVYRITGVISVIGGWFITALLAFLLSSIILLIVYFGGLIAVIALVAVAVFFFIRSNVIHKKREETESEKSQTISNSFIEETKLKLQEITGDISNCYTDAIDAVCKFKHKKLKKRFRLSSEIEEKVQQYKNDIYPTLSCSNINFENSGIFYVQMIDYLNESANCLKRIIDPAFRHVDNNHKELTPAQIEGLTQISNPISFYFTEIINLIQKNSFSESEFESISVTYGNINSVIENVRSEQIKRIRSKEDPTRSSMLVIAMLLETQNLITDIQKMLKAYIDFRKSF
jgi:phosphate/sulfate permease